MYDEFLKRLWECASGECFNCSQYTPTTNASVCQKELMKQAADAIEELQKVANKLLAKYQEEATGMIWEYSGHIEKSLALLGKEVTALQAQIDGEG